MYKSPIELLITDVCNQVLEQQNEAIHQAVLHYVPNVDRDELVKALEYDRSQYEEGYMDGKADAMDELVKCKYCRWWTAIDETSFGYCNHISYYVENTEPPILGENWFCCGGERKIG
jgi:hypothetical protein